MRCWERARQGDGQLVLIVGEPGIGKSRLIEEFHGRLRDTPHTWSEWTCSQLLQNTPLHPIAEAWRQRFGGADVSAERRFAELESTLAQLKLDPGENAPLLAPLLDIPAPLERAPTLAPDELRRRQLAALTAVVMASARVQPVVLAIEDLHWADPTTLDVLRGIAERGALAPLFIVATTRPEFRPPWDIRSHRATISLAPLDRAQVRDMIAELSARHALPREVVDDVAARTGGVPLFVEELTRLLLERGEKGGIHVIPPSLQQSLMARLDRLGPAREVAQFGAVIGRGFSYGLLNTLAGMQDAALQAALEQLADADILLVQGLPPDSDYRFKHALIQDAAYENLLRSRRQVLHRRVAELLRDRFPDTAAAESEVLAHHFTQAGLTDAAIEWWGKAGDQALRRSAFEEAISHLSKAIEMADKTGEGASAAATAPASANRRLKLQTDLGKALMYSRGYGANESRAAFIRARELAVATEDATERFTIYYGLWIGNTMGGELGFAQEIAETFLREADRGGLTTECGFAHRLLGHTCLRQGDLIEAQANLVEALSLYDPERDRETRFRFGLDTGAIAKALLAITKWQLGEVGPARALIEDAVAHAIETGHVPTLVHAYFYRAHFEIVRGDAGAARRNAEIVVKLSQENALTLFAAWGALQSAWASARLDGRETGATELRQAVAVYTDQGSKLGVPFYQGLLAEIEAQGDTEGALTLIDQALALAGETGEHWSDALLHRLRGEILLERDPANTAPSEDAFFTAIALAQQQKARSFELRAALSLARLYQSTDRPADAHAVLASALKDFSPTPEFPEIAEAQALLAALAETDEVKNAAASRQRRLKLQTDLGKALMYSRGYGAEESRTAFIRARELAAAIEDATERFTIYYGLWVGNIVRGELTFAREIAETFLRNAERGARTTECGFARRLLGYTSLWQGYFTEAQSNLVEALSICDPERDRETISRFGADTGAAAKVYLANTMWLLGEVEPARALIQEAVAYAIEIDHVPTLLNIYGHKAHFEIVRGDAEAARRDAEIVVELSQENALRGFAALGALHSAWASARRDGRETGATELRRALAVHTDLGKIFVPFFQVLLAEIEAQGDAGGALTRIDEALVLAGETGEHWSDAFLHRLRGEILLKRDPTNTAPAEEAFLTAIAIAHQQKARSFELRAALSLAKLYHSTDRPADAHAVLASAVKGFSPTPEFPEIEQAQALLAALAETDEVKNAAASRQRRLKLQTDLGKALMYSRGFGAEEPKAAFIRARELAAAIDDATERFTIYFGLWLGNLVRGELRLAREIAETFLREAEHGARRTECGVGRRLLGITCLTQGDFVEAEANFVEALSIYDPERDREAAFRFGPDTGSAARAYLAITKWQFGEVGPARALIEESVAHAIETGHVPTLVNTYVYKAHFEMIRGDAGAARRDAEMVIQLSQENAMTQFAAHGALQSAWASARLDGRETGAMELRRALAAYADQGNKVGVPFYQGLLAEIEAQGEAEGALTRIEEALALAGETGEHWNDVFLHRLRGEILLKRDPVNTAVAEDAFLTAIAVAQQQKARSFELRAALSLAKLYHSIDRPVDAHVVLATALKGFSPTAEFPEIEQAQAQALLSALMS
jgi:predicted ATPase